MDWPQVRISLLIATLPGLIFALKLITDSSADTLDRTLTIFFTIAWLVILATYLLPIRGGQ